MNHVYRLVWSRVCNAWIAVAETARGRHKGSGRTLLATALSLSAAVANATPHGGQVVSGSGVISTSGGTTTITQSSPTLSLTWQSFDIAPQQSVDFVQPSASSIAINDILSTTGTEILGHLNANGQIYLINPNGIIFGKGAQVNVGGLVASTLALDPGSSSGETRSFGGKGAGSVINEGSIAAAPGGYVAFIGRNVINQGTIVARRGSIALGAGSAVTLSFRSDALVGMQVTRSSLKAVAANGGLISADGGRVILTAGAKSALLASVVNNTGVIEARTVEDHGGTIELLGGAAGGTVSVGGTLDASAPNGGNGGAIETSAAHVTVAGDAKVTTAAAHGLVGSWVIDPHDFTVAASGGDETGAQLSAALANNNVQLESSAGAASGSGNVNIDDTVSWSANTTLTLTASNDVNVNASVTASGTGAGLTIDPNSANGADAASGTGTLNLAAGASINLPNVAPSSPTALVIGGHAYTVINSLGAAGSTTGTDLQGIDGNLSGLYALGSDIDASGTSSWNAGKGFTPIGGPSTPFTGTLDGLGHTIGNLTIDRGASVYVGLFAYTGSAGVIENIGLEGGSITGGQSTGALVGENSGTIQNSYATSTVSGSYNVGGLVGLNYGTVAYSHATGAVANSSYSTGGLVGTNGNYGNHATAHISNSYATGAVSSTAADVGGLAGTSYGTIADSYATGAAVSTATYAMQVGGLVGALAGSVTDSFAAGSATGSSGVGGLAGRMYFSGSISDSYAAGRVTGASNAGGLVGQLFPGFSGSISDSFWNTTTTGQSSSAAGTGLTTAQMLTASDFTGFNFTTTPGAAGNEWVMVDSNGSLNNAGGAAGATFPMLASEYSTTIVNAQQLQLVAMAPSASYSLGADIDATATDGSGGVWSSSGFVPLGSSSAPFTGTLDGRGHTIGNLTISQTSSSSSDTGLFGYVGATGLLTNVGVVGASVTGYGTAGALAGYNAGTIINGSSTGSVHASTVSGGLVGANYGTISNSQSAAAVSSRYSIAGGLAGNNAGTIDASYATGSVTSGGYGTGGLVGENQSAGSISDSHATGTVSATGSYGRRAGGLVGTGYGGTVTSSYATGTVSGNHAIGGLIGASWATVTDSFASGSVAASNGQGGGLIGVNLGSTSDSYATGGVSGSGSQFGGLVGGNGGTVSNSYAIGTVDALTSYVGGLVGGNYGTVTDSYSTGTVTGSSSVGGLVGGNQYGSGSTSGSFWDVTSSGQSGSTGGTGLTDSQMKQQSSFSGWDFTHAWALYGGETDPLLQSFMTPLTVTASNTTVTYSGTAYSGGSGVTYSVTPGSALLGTLTYGGSAQGAIDAGTYTITPQGLYSDQQGYLITFANGSLTVNPATLTYTASPASLTAGQTPSGLTGTITGFVGGDTLASVTAGTPLWTTSATASSPAGSYAIDGHGLTAANYVFAQAPGNATALTLAPAPTGNSGSPAGTGSSGGGTGGSSGGAPSSSSGAGNSPGNPAGPSGGAGSSGSSPDVQAPPTLLGVLAQLEAEVLPSPAAAVPAGTGPDAAPGQRGASSSGSAAPIGATSSGDMLELDGNGSLRVEHSGVRLPADTVAFHH